MPRSATRILLRDELVGFARSKVMIVLWVILPLLAIGGYLLLPAMFLGGMSNENISATTFISLLISSLAGTVAALMVAVDIVSERNRKVYDLFVIRPIKRDAIIWAKFIAVFVCVSLACVVSLAAGLLVDAIRGSVPTGRDLVAMAKPIASLFGVIAISTGVGVMFGVLARTILVAVILILYVGQNLAIVPMLPIYFRVMPDQFWLVMLFSFGLAGALGYGAAVLFRRAEF